MPVSGPRVRFQDVKPFDVPATLSELRGRATGWIELPHHVHWGPVRARDLSIEGDVDTAYQAVICEGSLGDQRALLNAARLVEVWPRLALPTRIREAWESRFPELSAAPE